MYINKGGIKHLWILNKVKNHINHHANNVSDNFHKSRMYPATQIDKRAEENFYSNANNVQRELSVVSSPLLQNARDILNRMIPFL